MTLEVKTLTMPNMNAQLPDQPAPEPESDSARVEDLPWLATASKRAKSVLESGKTVAYRAQFAIVAHPYWKRTAELLSGRSRRDWLFAGVTLFLLLIVFLLLMQGWHTPPSPNGPEEQLVARWLDAQVAGGTGVEHYSDQSNGAIHFEGLRSWRILARPCPNQYLVQIESAVPGSGHATGECRVSVSGGPHPRIVRAELLPPIRTTK